LRYDEPAFGIAWPLPIAAISDADQKWPDYAEGRHD
jgi:dTDP-4-dehydrorhamnose 3,5-epimerase